MIQSDEMVRPEVYADALAIIAELEAQVADLERDKTAAVELARRWRERADQAETSTDRYLEIAVRVERERDQARAELRELGAELLALRHRDLLGRAAGREMVGSLHLDRWAELEAAGWVVREGAVFVLTARGEEVWRG